MPPKLTIRKAPHWHAIIEFDSGEQVMVCDASDHNLDSPAVVTIAGPYAPVVRTFAGTAGLKIEEHDPVYEAEYIANGNLTGEWAEVPTDQHIGAQRFGPGGKHLGFSPNRPNRA